MIVEVKRIMTDSIEALKIRGMKLYYLTQVITLFAVLSPMPKSEWTATALVGHIILHVMI